MAGFEVEIEILGTYFFLFFHEKIGVDETYPPQSRDFLSNYSVTTQSAELQMIMKVIMTWGDNTFSNFSCMFLNPNIFFQFEF